MLLDRLLIACSIFELSFLACEQGPSCYTIFQWVTISLLLVKLAVCLDAMEQRQR